MTHPTGTDYSKKILTIPNILSLFRLCLIPVLIYQYCILHDPICTTLTLTLSGLTDVVDGFIARKWNMVSDFGKAFDPVADKLTQIAMLFCLLTQFPKMIIPFGILLIKEICTSITSLLTIRKTKTVLGAVWHGKLTTVMLYGVMVIHLIFPGISGPVSDLLLTLVTIMMLLSFLLYSYRNLKILFPAACGAFLSRLSKVLYRFIHWIVALVYPKFTVKGTENLPDEACIIVGNHTQLNGPVCAELYFPGERTIWCASQMMSLKEVPGYAFEDFWSRKPKYTHWFYKLLSYIIAPLSVCIFNNAHTIPVFHDNRLLSTFKKTITALDDGTNVVIYPECYTPHNQIVNQFQEKFVDVAKLYHKRTGKAVSFVPMYIAPELKTMYLGKPITFSPDTPIDAERSRICNYLMDEITNIATGLPKHLVVPYENVSRKHYRYNITEEATAHENAGR